MKKQYLIIAFLLSCAASIVYSQKRVITGDGKVVQLNQDRTWAYYTETDEDLPSIEKWRAARDRLRGRAAHWRYEFHGAVTYHEDPDTCQLGF